MALLSMSSSAALTPSNSMTGPHSISGHRTVNHSTMPNTSSGDSDHDPLESYFVSASKNFDKDTHIDWNETFQRAWTTFTNFRGEHRKEEVSEIVWKFDVFAKRSVIAIVHCLLGVPMSDEEKHEAALWKRVRGSAYFYRWGNMFVRIWANERAGHAQHQAMKAVLSIRQEGVHVPLSVMVKYRGVVATVQALVPLPPNSVALCADASAFESPPAATAATTSGGAKPHSAPLSAAHASPPASSATPSPKKAIPMSSSSAAVAAAAQLAVERASSSKPAVRADDAVARATIRRLFESMNVIWKDDQPLPPGIDVRAGCDGRLYIVQAEGLLPVLEAEPDVGNVAGARRMRFEALMLVDCAMPHFSDRRHFMELSTAQFVREATQYLKATSRRDAANEDTRRQAQQWRQESVMEQLKKIGMKVSMLGKLIVQAESEEAWTPDQRRVATEIFGVEILARSAKHLFSSLLTAMRLQTKARSTDDSGVAFAEALNALLKPLDDSATSLAGSVERKFDMTFARMPNSDRYAMEGLLFALEMVRKSKQKLIVSRLASLCGAELIYGKDGNTPMPTSVSIGDAKTATISSSASFRKKRSSSNSGPQVNPYNNGVSQQSRLHTDLFVKWIPHGAEKYTLLPFHHRLSSAEVAAAAATPTPQPDMVTSTTSSSVAFAPSKSVGVFSSSPSNVFGYSSAMGSPSASMVPSNVSPAASPMKGAGVAGAAAAAAAGGGAASSAGSDVPRGASSGAAAAPEGVDDFYESGNQETVTSPVRLYACGLLNNAFRSMRLAQPSVAMRPLTAQATHWKERFGPQSFEVAWAHTYLCVCHTRTKRVTAAMTAYRDAIAAFTGVQQHADKQGVRETMWLARSQRVRAMLNVVAELRIVAPSTGVPVAEDVVNTVLHCFDDNFFFASSELVGQALFAARDLIDGYIKAEGGAKTPLQVIQALQPLFHAAEQCAARALELSVNPQLATCTALLALRLAVDHGEWLNRSHAAAIVDDGSQARGMAFINTTVTVCKNIQDADVSGLAMEPFLCRYQSILAIALLASSTKARDTMAFLDEAEAYSDEAVQTAEFVCGPGSREYEQCLRDQMVLYDKCGRRDEAAAVRLILQQRQLKGLGQHNQFHPIYGPLSSRDLVRRVQIQMGQMTTMPLDSTTSYLEQGATSSPYAARRMTAASVASFRANLSANLQRGAGGSDVVQDFVDHAVKTHAKQQQQHQSGIPAFQRSMSILRVLDGSIRKAGNVSRTSASRETASTLAAMEAAAQAAADRERQRREQEDLFERQRAAMEEDEGQQRLLAAAREHKALQRLPFVMWPELAVFEDRTFTLQQALFTRLSLTLIKPFIRARMSGQLVADVRYLTQWDAAEMLQRVGRGLIARAACGLARGRFMNRKLAVAKRVELTTKTSVSSRVLEQLASRTLVRVMRGYRARHMVFKRWISTPTGQRIMKMLHGSVDPAAVAASSSSSSSFSSSLMSPTRGRRAVPGGSGSDSTKPSARRMMAFEVRRDALQSEEQDGRLYLLEAEDDLYSSLLHRCDQGLFIIAATVGQQRWNNHNNMMNNGNNSGMRRNHQTQHAASARYNHEQQQQQQQQQRRVPVEKKEPKQSDPALLHRTSARYSNSLLYPRPPPPSVGGWLENLDLTPSMAARRQEHQLQASVSSSSGRLQSPKRK